MKLQRLGGYSAIATVCMAIAYYVFGSIMQKQLGDMTEPAKVIAAVATAPVNFYILNLMSIFANLLGMIFICALHERLKDDVPHLARIMLIAASFASALYMVSGMMYINAIAMIVPVKDASAYRAMDVSIAGMTSMSDHAWGWVYLLIGCAVLKTRAFSAILGWLSLLVGIFWLPWFIVKPFGFDLIGLFSLAPFFISTIWFGIILLRQKPLRAEAK